MERTIIRIPSTIKYLSEFITDLPHNVILDKGKIGAGGTSVAIQNNESYVICVPYLALIENKTAQNSNLLGVNGKTKPAQIKKYLESDIYPKKIMVTYDSLCNLMELISPTDFRLLVDEKHLLFTAYSWRHDACLCVLNNYDKFKSYCFMTATVLEDEFMLTELKHIPIIEYVWDNTAEVTVHSLQCKQTVIPTVLNIVTQFLTNKLEGNAYFFVNSVEFISEVVRLCKLTNDNCRAIYSTANKQKLPIRNSDTFSQPKKINFITSKAFEGVDFYDKDARIYIVSDKSKSQTLADISTQVNQISGRVRDTQYWQHIGHIYTTTRYNVDMTYAQYKKETDNGIVESNELVSEYSSLSEKARSRMSLEESSYISKRGNNFIFDENLVKVDLFNFKVTKCLYKYRVNLTQEYQKYDFKVVELKSQIKDSFELSNYFKETVIECQKKDSDYLLWAFNKYPFLHAAIVHIGFERMEELDYNQQRIKRELIQHTCKTDSSKIKSLLTHYKEIQTGNFVSNKRIKEILKEVYNVLNITKAPTAMDMNEFCLTKSCQKMLKKEKINGVLIIKIN